MLGRHCCDWWNQLADYTSGCDDRNRCDHQPSDDRYHQQDLYHVVLHTSVIPNLIDTHSHLHFGAYDEDRDAVLLRMQEQGIQTIVVGTNGATSKAAVAFAERSASVFASVGYHPSHMIHAIEEDYEEADPNPYDPGLLRQLASANSVVAIGETGLDYSYLQDRDDIEMRKVEQRRVFKEHLEIAHELHLPVIIHARDTYDEISSIISQQSQPVRGVMHCYNGTWAEAERLLAIGLMISFTGLVTFKPKKSIPETDQLQRVAERIPLDRFMIETDAPWLAPEPNRGKRNDPTMVKYIAEKIAELRGITLEEVAVASTQNAMRFFRLDEHIHS
ncbi:YchF/TatD family DNA exonuclease [Candidatus Uhrbacteria bacterium]|nr:YchF/TatD family DNA exonuclease [Candidatus Uhrbacteria bacterium]MBD3284527.1 YchF/TatD family DNA exonuclease [Candidatus Uhrbacteria bacterium]